MPTQLAGEELLREHARTRFAPMRTQAGSRVLHFCGYGHSNTAVIVGETSLILVDALDSPDSLRAVLAEAAGLPGVAGKQVKTLIYTHGHPDHRGGAGAVRDTVEEVIAFSPCKPPLPHFDRIDGVLRLRGRNQHGYGLTDEEAICQGIGPREGKEQGLAPYDFVPPTRTYRMDLAAETDEERGVVGPEGIELVIDGVRLRLVPTPGETDDACTVFLPEERIAICGDVYYACWPNIYAIRGTSYRDVSMWIGSLSALMGLDAEILLPGHMRPVLGAEEVRDRVGALRDALAWVLDETLSCLSAGMTLEETVEAVRLPEPFASDPDLQEFYGTVAWSVRSIYNGYVGWFDGDPAALAPVPAQAWGAELTGLIGVDRLLTRTDELVAAGEFQMALQLLRLLPERDCERERVCLFGRARQMTSANARHYLIACARWGALGDAGAGR